MKKDGKLKSLEEIRILVGDPLHKCVNHYGDEKYMNRKFLRELRKAVGRRRRFTFSEAVEVYTRTRDGGFGGMNTGNALGSAVAHGLVVRISRGEYRFVKGAKL